MGTLYLLKLKDTHESQVTDVISTFHPWPFYHLHANFILTLLAPVATNEYIFKYSFSQVKLKTFDLKLTVTGFYVESLFPKVTGFQVESLFPERQNLS